MYFLWTNALIREEKNSFFNGIFQQKRRSGKCYSTMISLVFLMKCVNWEISTLYRFLLLTLFQERFFWYWPFNILSSDLGLPLKYEVPWLFIAILQEFLSKLFSYKDTNIWLTKLAITENNSTDVIVSVTGQLTNLFLNLDFWPWNLFLTAF